LSYLSWLDLSVLFALAGSAVVPRLGNDWFGAVEKFAVRFAARGRLVPVAVGLSALLARLSLLWLMPVPVPLGHDEFSYLLAGDTFALGRVANPAHPMWLFLDTLHVFQHPTYSSMFPPAQGAVLALGQLLGHPWIGVLLSMALMCATLAWMLQGWFPPAWALFGAVLVVLRFSVFNYWVDSYWGGAVAAIGGALVLGALPRIIRQQRVLDSLTMGVGVALLANSRPLEGALFCIPVAVTLVFWLFSGRGPCRAKILCTILPLSCILGLTLVWTAFYNWRITKNPFLLPHALYQRQYIAYPIFIWQSPGPPRRYSNPQFEAYFNGWVRTAFVPSWRQTWRKCVEWWQFFLRGTLSIPFLTLPWMIKDRRIRLPLVQFVWCALGLLAVRYFKPHYAAPLAATLVVLLVQGMRHLRRWQCAGRPVGIGMTRVIILFVAAMVPAHIGKTMLDAHRGITWSDPEMIARARIARQLDVMPGEHLVIVRYAPSHDVHQEWVYNSADVDHSKVVWARAIPGVDLQPLLEYFRDRKVWTVEPDSADIQLQEFARPSGVDRQGDGSRK
jgi:hypothetical protein